MARLQFILPYPSQRPHILSSRSSWSYLRAICWHQLWVKRNCDTDMAKWWSRKTWVLLKSLVVSNCLHSMTTSNKQWFSLVPGSMEEKTCVWILIKKIKLKFSHVRDAPAADVPPWSSGQPQQGRSSMSLNPLLVGCCTKTPPEKKNAHRWDC